MSKNFDTDVHELGKGTFYVTIYIRSFFVTKISDEWGKKCKVILAKITNVESFAELWEQIQFCE